MALDSDSTASSQQRRRPRRPRSFLSRLDHGTMRSPQLVPGHHKHAATGWSCPLFTSGVYHALADCKSSVRERLEQAVPSIWAADSEPTTRDVESWRTTLLDLLEELQKQYRLPFAWFVVRPGAKRRRGQDARPVWHVFSSKVFAAFYRIESLQQSASEGTTHAECQHASTCAPALERLYAAYFGADVADDSALDGVASLTGDQAIVWSILMALYTIGVLGSAVKSTVVGKRVQQIVDALWPCVRRVALGMASFT
ncbi:hypothetical protein Purlil1_12904 [Purpureocillium lilacinum]|uniref:Uncharacterized protein n=1 Tax=Purpureocillium lilacinum TaxID=33203 RepID=A0ABR0BFY3_PURLI|nr:hypothetical protein Purlil1_12904 [Purpureocillium lilacinum]